MLNSQYIYGPNGEKYDINYNLVSSAEEKKKMPPIPLATDFNDKKEYEKAMEEWYNTISEETKDSILPVPISVAVRYPNLPHIPVPGEKTGRFNAKKSLLYPTNHLEMQKMAVTGEQLPVNFSNPGPHGEDIPVEYQLKQDKYFSSTFTPLKPEPYFFASYEDYKLAMERWIKISTPLISEVPTPSELGAKLVLTTDEEDTENKEEKVKKAPKEIKRPEFVIDSRFKEMEPLSPDFSGLYISNLCGRFKKRLMSKRSETNIVKLDLMTINVVSDEELRSRERSNFLYTLTSYNAIFIDPNLYENALRMTLNHGCSRHYRYAVFTVVEGYLNKKNGDIGYMLKNSVELIYAFTALIKEFSPVKVTVYDPGEDVIDTNDDEMILNHAKSVFLELSYNKAMLTHYASKKKTYREAYNALELRGTGLLLQAKQLINFMADQLLTAIKNCFNKKYAYTISLIVILAIESGCEEIDLFLTSPTFSFFNIAIELNKCDPDVWELLQKRIIFSKEASTKLLPVMFSLFSQLNGEKIKDNMQVIMKLITGLFMLDPRTVKNDVASFVPFYFAKFSLLSDPPYPDIIFQAILQMCQYVKRAVKLTPVKRNNQDERVVIETLKYVFGFIKCTSNATQRIYILRSIKSLIFFNFPKLEAMVNTMDIDVMKFIFASTQARESEVSINAWKIVSRLLAQNRIFRLKVIRTPEVLSILKESCYRPNYPCMYYVLRMLSQAMTKRRKFSVKVLIQALNIPIQQDFNDFKEIVIAPDVKIESFMRTLISHESTTFIPMHFHVIHICEQVLTANDELRKAAAKKKKGRRMTILI